MVVVADPSPFLKLWWKGVDIAATVISTILSALVAWFAAFLFWNWKKRRDLRYDREKKEQEIRLEAEHPRNERIQQRDNRLARLKMQRKALRDRAEAAVDGPRQFTTLREICTDYKRWIAESHLAEYPPTDEHLRSIRDVIDNADNVTDVTQALSWLIGRIYQTPLPPVEDDTFPW